METLVLLQLVTIAFTIISLVVGYLLKLHEIHNDNKSMMFTDKLINGLHTLRENVAIILASANPSTIKESNDSKKKELYLIKIPLGEINTAISSIKSIFFPFYPQENSLLASLERLKNDLELFVDNPNNIEVEGKLKRQIREVYLEYALYDRAMWSAIIKQTTQSEYNFYTFDEYYDEFSKDMDLEEMKEQMRDFTRKGQEVFVDEEEVAELQETQTKINSKNIALPDY